jgi:TnpA family transposase
MPVQFLTDTERVRLNAFPAEIAPDDLITYFTLSPADRAQLHPLRGDQNRLGFVLQLGTLRYLGFCPDDLTRAPATVVAYLAEQLGVAPAALADYGTRAQTRTDHLQHIQRYLGFRDADLFDLAALTDWLLERALEHDQPMLLLQLAIEKLYADRIVRPGITRLERMVATARSQAQQETFRRLEPLLTDERRTLLDGLLQADPATGRAPLIALRLGATSYTPRAILDTIAKLTVLQDHSVTDWQLAGLSPNRLKFLAQLGRKSPVQVLQRMPDERRYPILLAFLQQALEAITDEAVELADRCLSETDRRARHDLDEFRRTVAQALNAQVQVFQEILGIVLNPAIPDAAVRPAIYAQTPAEELQAIAAQGARLVRPVDDTYFDFFEDRYSYLRQFTPAWLDTLTFRSHQLHDPLLAGITLIRRLNTERRTKIPADWPVPLGFVPAKWLPYVEGPDGRIDRHYYELCLLWQMRNALRAGNLWLEHSRRYADPETYLIPRPHWPTLRPELCQLLQVPEHGMERLRVRRAELEAQLARFDRGLPRNQTVRLEEGELVVTPLVGEELPPHSERLQAVIDARLPQIDLPVLLVEVDRLTHFSDCFEHASGQEPRTPEVRLQLYAAILAQACNFGLTQMAQVTDLSYRQLAWCTNWYLREETLNAANAVLVNYHHRLPLSQIWGGGTLSSSDGQRFPVAVKTKNATALPRYFGYGRGLTHYTWTSDQHGQYGTKVIPSTARDATYVLDAILDNETELPIVEHTVDTNGFTEIVFALFDLLNLQFSPRIRDIGDQRLYRIDRTIRYRHLEPVLKGMINQARILAHWDDMLRVAGSLKYGWVTASLFISKLQAFPRQNALAQALQEYGRLIKTIFMVRYLQSPPYRHRINAQLNKGESLHALRQFLFFANEGKIRQRYEEDQVNQASCLTLVTNAVITWNTVYMAAVLDQLRAEGHVIADADVVHLSPARSANINRYGKYRFNLNEELERTQLRPLRKLRTDEEQGSA